MNLTSSHSLLLDPEEDNLIHLLQERQAELDSLFTVANAINKNATIEYLLQMASFSLQKVIKVGRALLLIKDDAEQFSVWTHFGLKCPTDKEVNFIGNLLLNYTQRTYLKTSTIPKPLHYFDYFLPVNSHSKSNVAVYVLLGDYNPSVLTIENNLKYIETLISLISVAMENKKLLEERIYTERFKREIELAKEVQENLIPNGLRKILGFEMGFKYKAHHIVGGDYFDVIEVDSDKLIWCIADVSGKGVSAALLMANTQASLRAWISTGMDLVNIVKHLNRTVYQNSGGERFLTLFIALYNRRTRVMEYINAGHPKAILVDKIGARFLGEGTTIIGAFDKLPFLKMGEVEIMEDSLLVNYTDGLIEREDGELLDEIDLAEWLENCTQQQSIDQINEQLMLYVDNYFGHKPTADDVTLLTIRIN